MTMSRISLVWKYFTNLVLYAFSKEIMCAIVSCFCDDVTSGIGN